MKRPFAKVLKRCQNRTGKKSVRMSPQEGGLMKALKDLLDKGKGHIVDPTQSKAK